MLVQHWHMNKHKVLIRNTRVLQLTNNADVSASWQTRWHWFLHYDNSEYTVPLSACASPSLPLWICILVVKPLGNLFLWVARAGQMPRSAVAPDGGSLDPVCCVLGVKRRRSRADVCSHQQPDFKAGWLHPYIMPPFLRVPECLASKVLLE